MTCEVTAVIYTEENGRYRIDCTKAVSSTDSIHALYQNAGIHIKDVDFVIEGEDYLLLVEYKNANISGASNPNGFRPEDDKKIEDITRKYYDSLHYLTLMGKGKPKYYIYILEYPTGDCVTRRRIRNRLKTELPFSLQDQFEPGIRLIEKIDVLSIEEWNMDSVYGNYPILPTTAYT